MHRFEQDAARIVCKEQMQTLSGLGFSLVPITDDLHMVEWRGHGLELCVRGNEALTVEVAMGMIVSLAIRKGGNQVRQEITSSLRLR